MDYEHINLLLYIIRKSRDYPRLKAIHDAAMKELEEISADLEKPVPEPKPVASSYTPSKPKEKV